MHTHIYLYEQAWFSMCVYLSIHPSIDPSSYRSIFRSIYRSIYRYMCVRVCEQDILTYHTKAQVRSNLRVSSGFRPWGCAALEFWGCVLRVLYLSSHKGISLYLFPVCTGIKHFGIYTYTYRCIYVCIYIYIDTHAGIDALVHSCIYAYLPYLPTWLDCMLFIHQSIRDVYLHMDL